MERLKNDSTKSKGILIKKTVEIIMVTDRNPFVSWCIKNKKKCADKLFFEGVVGVCF